ncbi:hypothetical protein KOY_02984 [Bacillus cereus VDM021]|nr:hypothetical protein IIW_02088 [Bacillus cereus VD136]EOP68546.1 hypothetical protein KOW_03755 [Bacillus cereus VDM006]EOQ05198.1 hypothetical protein KOY_02984 [Bacillus cereus VDM021]
MTSRLLLDRKEELLTFWDKYGNIEMVIKLNL